MAQQAQIHSRCRDQACVLDVPQIAKLSVIPLCICYGPGPMELLFSIEQIAWPAVPAGTAAQLLALQYQFDATQW